MNVREFVGGGLLLAALGMWPAAAAAQNVGTGPLTGALADTEPTAGVIGLGPLKLAPGLVVRELGWDSNVFDEAINPKEDYVAAAMPDVAVFTRTRFAQISTYVGADLVYYRTYDRERSLGYAARGRVDLLLSRVRPFFGVGETFSRTRPNGEIDVRANLRESEISGGLAFELGAHQKMYVSAVRSITKFEDAVEEGVELAQVLSRDVDTYSGGVQTDITPLLTLTMFGSYGKDSFRNASERDTERYSATANFKFKAEAVLSGTAAVSYLETRPTDPLVERFRGVTGSVALAYPFMEIGRLTLVASRAVEYSFDVAEGYYVSNNLTLGYTHRLFGDVDAQVRGLKSLYDYGYRVGAVAHRDTIDALNGSLGYNLRNRTRVSLNYEYSRRRSPSLADRNYDKRRLFLSWTYAF